MHEPQTWCELPGQRIENPQERRLTNALQVTPITLMRGVSQESNPHLQLLQRLLDALPGFYEPEQIALGAFRYFTP